MPTTCRRRRPAAAPRHRAPAVRGRRRLVRQPVEPAQPARGDRDADAAARGARRGARAPHRRGAVHLSLRARHRTRGDALQRRGDRRAARVRDPRRLPARRRQLRPRRELSSRDRPRLPRPAAGRSAGVAPDLPPCLRLSRRLAQGARARRRTGARARHLHRATGWRSSTARPATSATAGRTWARTRAIRRSCTSVRCAWV